MVFKSAHMMISPKTKKKNPKKKELTFGVCDLTLPARASDPWTFPILSCAFNQKKKEESDKFV